MNPISITDIIALFAAIIALVALAYQLRGNKNQLKLQNFIEYTKRYQSIVLNFPENINDKDFDISKIDNDLAEKLFRLMRLYFDLCSEQYYLHSAGLIDKELWLLYENGMKTTFSKPAFKQSWEKISKDTKFDDHFVFFVKKTINK
jgi:hypothetical protein